MRKFLLLLTLTVSMAVMGQDVKCQEGHCAGSADKHCGAHQGGCKEGQCAGSADKHCGAHQGGCKAGVCKNDTTGKRDYDHYKKVDFLEFDVAIGWGIMTNKPEGAKSNFFRSRDFIIGLRYRYTPPKALQTYSVGLWAQFSRYALDDKMFYKKSDNVVDVKNFAEGTSNQRSCINIFSLSVPFFFTQKFGQNSNWSVTLGPVVNFNLRGRVNNDYDIGDDNFDINTKGIEYRPVTVDLMGVLKYKGVGVYCKYSPMSVLKKDMGPQFKSVTLGVFL